MEMKDKKNDGDDDGGGREGLIPQPGISGAKIEGSLQGSLRSVGRLEAWDMHIGEDTSLVNVPSILSP